MLKDLSPLCPRWKRNSLSWRVACLQVGWGESLRHLHEFASEILGEDGPLSTSGRLLLPASWPSQPGHNQPHSCLSFLQQPARTPSVTTGVGASMGDHSQPSDPAPPIHMRLVLAPPTGDLC